MKHRATLLSQNTDLETHLLYLCPCTCIYKPEYTSHLKEAPTKLAALAHTNIFPVHLSIRTSSQLQPIPIIHFLTLDLNANPYAK